MEEPNNHQQYQKYKKCVKLWETNFKRKNGRIPSKVSTSINHTILPGNWKFSLMYCTCGKQNKMFSALWKYENSEWALFMLLMSGAGLRITSVNSVSFINFQNLLYLFTILSLMVTEEEIVYHRKWASGGPNCRWGQKHFTSPCYWSLSLPINDLPINRSHREKR